MSNYSARNRPIGAGVVRQTVYVGDLDANVFTKKLYPTYITDNVYSWTLNDSNPIVDSWVSTMSGSLGNSEFVSSDFTGNLFVNAPDLSAYPIPFGGFTVSAEFSYLTSGIPTVYTIPFNSVSVNTSGSYVYAFTNSTSASLLNNSYDNVAWVLKNNAQATIYSNNNVIINTKNTVGFTSQTNMTVVWVRTS